MLTFGNPFQLSVGYWTINVRLRIQHEGDEGILNNIARVFNLNHIKRNKKGLVAKEHLNYLAMVVRYVYDEREEK